MCKKGKGISSLCTWLKFKVKNNLNRVAIRAEWSQWGIGEGQHVIMLISVIYFQL